MGIDSGHTVPMPFFPIAPLDKMPPLMQGIGTHHRAITTSSPLAQRYFDQGLALFYGFHKNQALQSFRAATKCDPNCAMAYWGIAMAVGPDINFASVDKANSIIAVEALEKASLLPGSLLESDLIAATKVRYSRLAPANRASLDQAYSQKIAQLWKENPTDTDLGCLYAESLLDLSPWNQWKPNGQPTPGTLDAVKAVQEVLKIEPTHPFANHLLIHAVEASPHPETAEQAADRLCTLQPALGHMVHMPSHIYVRIGRWNDAVVQNAIAIKMDAKFGKRHGNAPTYVGYLVHNRMMLAYAASMIGRRKAALDALSDLGDLMPTKSKSDFSGLVDTALYMPLDVKKRFGKWDDILAEPEYASCFPVSRAMRHAFRAIAFAVKGNSSSAKSELAKFTVARKQVPKDYGVGLNTATAVLDIAQHLATGEVLFKAGQTAAGLAEMRAAVKSEDALNYDEPADWMQPTRHTLAAALLASGKSAEAEAVYRKDLQRLPGNGWSLLGLSQALRKQGKTSEADKFYAQYLKAWTGADTATSSSCLCLPNQ